MAWTTYRYAVVNLVISIMTFGRNVLFMRTIGVEDLAQVVLMQTLVMLVGFLQIGMLNGAYVSMAQKDADLDSQIVNQVWSGLGLIMVIIGVAVGVGLTGFRPPVITSSTLIFGCLAGLVTLGSTFLNNALVAHGHLDRANILGLIAVSVSLILGTLSAQGGLFMAQIAILSQPLLLAFGILVVSARLRPTRFAISRDIINTLLRIGLPAFISMLFLLLSYQLERWTIVFSLGEEALGRFYLVIMYINFFILFPTSLLNMHIPLALRALNDGSKDALQENSKAHFNVLIVFLLLAAVLTFFALEPILRLVLPEFEAEARLVYLVFPAMVLFVLRDNANLVFFALKRTGAVMYSTAVFFATYAGLMMILLANSAFSLETLIYARAMAAFCGLIAALVLRRRVLAEII